MPLKGQIQSALPGGGTKQCLQQRAWSRLQVLELGLTHLNHCPLVSEPLSLKIWILHLTSYQVSIRCVHSLSESAAARYSESASVIWWNTFSSAVTRVEELLIGSSTHPVSAHTPDGPPLKGTSRGRLFQVAYRCYVRKYVHKKLYLHNQFA